MVNYRGRCFHTIQSKREDNIQGYGWKVGQKIQMIEIIFGVSKRPERSGEGLCLLHHNIFQIVTDIQWRIIPIHNGGSEWLCQNLPNHNIHSWVLGKLLKRHKVHHNITDQFSQIKISVLKEVHKYYGQVGPTVGVGGAYI